MGTATDLKLLGIMRAQRVLLGMRPEMSLAVATAFFAVAFLEAEERRKAPPTLKEVSVFADLPYSSISRHIRYLSDFERPGKPGANLVVMGTNPDNRRENQVRLTDAGRLLARQVIQLLG